MEYISHIDPLRKYDNPPTNGEKTNLAFFYLAFLIAVPFGHSEPARSYKIESFVPRCGCIFIQGNVRTKDAAILNSLRIKCVQEITIKNLLDSQTNLVILYRMLGMQWYERPPLIVPINFHLSQGTIWVDLMIYVPF